VYESALFFAQLAQAVKPGEKDQSWQHVSRSESPVWRMWRSRK